MKQLLILGLAALVHIIDLRRRLRLASARGDLYRDVALRLEQQLAATPDPAVAENTP